MLLDKFPAMVKQLTHHVQLSLKVDLYSIKYVALFIKYDLREAHLVLEGSFMILKENKYIMIM